MEYQRRRVLAVIGALPIYPDLPVNGVLYVKQLVPLDPPVTQPPPPDIQHVEELIKAALEDESEDKPISVDQIRRRQIELRSASDTNIDLAVRDLLWKRDIEEVGDKTPPEFRLVRSAQG